MINSAWDYQRVVTGNIGIHLHVFLPKEYDPGKVPLFHLMRFRHVSVSKAVLRLLIQEETL